MVEVGIMEEKILKVLEELSKKLDMLEEIKNCIIDVEEAVKEMGDKIK
jgi:hypothetical protein